MTVRYPFPPVQPMSTSYKLRSTGMRPSILNLTPSLVCLPKRVQIRHQRQQGKFQYHHHNNHQLLQHFHHLRYHPQVKVNQHRHPGIQQPTHLLRLPISHQPHQNMYKQRRLIFKCHSRLRRHHRPYRGYLLALQMTIPRSISNQIKPVSGRPVSSRM